MTSTFTTNKGIEKPAYNDYVNTWNTPENANFDIIDKAFGGSLSLNVTGVSATPVSLTTTQYQNLIVLVSGTLSNNVTYQLPSGVGGNFIVSNGTSGSYSLIFSSGGGGSSVVISQGKNVIIASDGTNIFLANTTLSAGGSTTQVQYNSSGILTGLSNFTYDGSTLTVPAISVGTAGLKGLSVAIQYAANGNGSVLTSGVIGTLVMPFSGTITQWTIVGDQTGSVLFGITSDTYASYGSNTSIIGTGTPPFISGSNKGQAAPTGWTTTTLTSGNIVSFSIASAQYITRATIALTITRT